MYCQNCGAQVPDASSTCPSCGLALPPQRPKPSAPARPLAKAPARAMVSPSTTGDAQAKSKVTAGLLGIFLGGFGVHRFYLGYTRLGVIQLVVSFATCGLGSLWGLVEGILIIAGSTITTDASGRSLRD